MLGFLFAFTFLPNDFLYFSSFLVGFWSRRTNFTCSFSLLFYYNLINLHPKTFVKVVNGSNGSFHLVLVRISSLVFLKFCGSTFPLMVLTINYPIPKVNTNMSIRYLQPRHWWVVKSQYHICFNVLVTCIAITDHAIRFPWFSLILWWVWAY